MIRFNITNFRRIETARIALQTVAVVGGLNGNGKTSLAQAIGIVLTGERMPGELGLTKLAECGVMVRSGAAEAAIKVAFGEADIEPTSTARMTYPNPEYKQEGVPIRCSRIAAGLESVLDYDDKKRAMELAKYLKTEPSFGDLLDAIGRAGIVAKEGSPKDPADEAETLAMEEHGLDARDPYDLRLYRYVAAIWRDIQGTGWDAVVKMVKDHGRKSKSSWEMTTGEKAYQPTGADTWRPNSQDWDDTLVTTSKETLEHDITTARDELEAEIAKGAVDKAEVARLQEVFNAYSISEHNKAKETLRQYNEAVPGEVAKLAALPKPEDTPTVCTCPHCGADSQLIKGADGSPMLQAEIIGMSADENAARRTAIADQQGVVERYTLQQTNWARAVERMQQAKEAATKAEAKLDELLAIPDNTLAIDAARKVLSRAQNRLELRQRKEAADKYHRAVVNNQKLIDILAPDGLRKTKLHGVLDAFNSMMMEPLCDSLGFKPITLDESMRFRYAGFPYGLVAKSEQWRIRVAVQLMLARIDESPVVVIDGMDIIDPKSRRDLINGVIATGMPAVILATLGSPEKMPPVYRIPGCTAYWVDNGVARRVVNVADGKAELE